MHYNWPMSAHASQAFSIAHCTDSEDLPNIVFVYATHIILHNVSGTAVNTLLVGYGYGYRYG